MATSSLPVAGNQREADEQQMLGNVFVVENMCSACLLVFVVFDSWALSIVVYITSPFVTILSRGGGPPREPSRCSWKRHKSCVFVVVVPKFAICLQNAKSSTYNQRRFYGKFLDEFYFYVLGINRAIMT